MEGLFSPELTKQVQHYNDSVRATWSETNKKGTYEFLWSLPTKILLPYPFYASLVPSSCMWSSYFCYLFIYISCFFPLREGSGGGSGTTNHFRKNLIEFFFFVFILKWNIYQLDTKECLKCIYLVDNCFFTCYFSRLFFFPFIII